MRRIAIYGGAFDPPHKGHMTVAEEVLKAGVVDEVWLMPCNNHSFGKEMSPSDHRVEMCKMVVEGKPNIFVSTFEIDAPVPITYTNELVRYLYKAHEEESIQFYYLIGMDNAINVDLWAEWEELINMIPFIIVPRDGVKQTSKSYWFNRPPHIFLDKVSAGDISSTCLREWIRKPSLENYVQKLESIDMSLLLYIKKHDLYQQESTLERNGIEVIATEPLLKTQFLDFMASEFVDLRGKTCYWTWAHRPGNRQAVVIAAIVKGDGSGGSIEKPMAYEDRLVVTKEFRVPLNYVDENPYEYGFPAGLVDENEPPEETAKRELQEETGLTVTKVLRRSPFVYNTPGVTDESIAIVFVEAEGVIDQSKNEHAEEIETMLLDRQGVLNLLKDAENMTKKLGAKFWLIAENFVRYGTI